VIERRPFEVGRKVRESKGKELVKLVKKEEKVRER
jgi:hypothetical protein